MAAAAAALVWLGSLLASDNAALAQALRLSATGGRVQQIAHDGQHAPQVFPEVKWIVINPQGHDGAIVNLDCEVFESTLDSRLKVDVRLDLRIIRTPGNAEWFVDKATDLSNIGSGDDSANVIASSLDSGNAQLGIVVTFFNHDASMLLLGEYETTLVGTITAN